MFSHRNNEGARQEKGQVSPGRATHEQGRVQSVRAMRARPALPPAIELPHTAGARGLAAMFGLDIRAAMLAVIVDLMVFSGDAISMGLLIPLGIGVACVLSFIVYKMQLAWGRDSHDSALIKALTIGLLTAIPFPLTPLVAVPAGVLGIVNSVRGNKW